MLPTLRRSRRGFTLIELAIVLAVSGLLFAGLWRLIAGGNQQLRDQSAASQQQQLITAVKGFLSSSQGQTFMGALAASTNGVLTLPPAASAPDGGANTACHTALGVSTSAFCDFLPAGFSAATTNPYGQVYNIRVLKDSTAAPSPPSTYSFMLMTSGGDQIPDTSGGRIAGLIGGDGGFIYSNSVCGATPTWACGAYGAWAQKVTDYGFAVPANGGYVASRSYITPQLNSTYPWLDRQVMSGDSTTSPVFNTMFTNLYLGGQTFYLGSNNTLTTGGGTIDMQGGTVNMQGGTISDFTNTGAQINLGVSATAPQLLTPGNNAFINLATGCTKQLTTPPSNSGIGGLPYNANCQVGMQITGDENVTGLVQAFALYAGSFIYQSSDIRLKTDIQPIANPLDNVMKLKPVSFMFKSNGAQGLGLIAQDVEKIYPQLVTPGSGMKSVNYDGLIAPLIGAVQELKQENDELRDQIHIQDLRQKKLEQELRHTSGN